MICAHRWPAFRAVSEAIADGVVSQDDVRDQAKHIERESIRLSAMVDDLFEISKINPGAVQAPHEKVALDEVADDVITAHRIAAERGCVALRIVLPDGPVRVLGSDRALVRLLSNMVGNAIADTMEGGTVGLALGADDDGAYARVDDHRRGDRRGRPAASVRRRLPRLQRSDPAH
jgi:signal transduction histidine kinase